MSRKQEPISVVPVWQPKVDRQLFVRLLFALVDQLVAEGTVDDELDVRGDDDVHPHDGEQVTDMGDREDVGHDA